LPGAAERAPASMADTGIGRSHEIVWAEK